ncbi:MAG TPA: DUF2442 domain-containing protein [Thermoanaerobaculia bacterium]|jgi:hypothetical protein
MGGRSKVESNRSELPLTAEVTNISPHGFWLLLGERELFVSFAYFPWFANASVAKIARVEWPSTDHLYWPELDVDLSVRSIEHPEDFPLEFASSDPG